MFFKLRPDKVRSFDEEKQRYGALEQRYVGVRPIEVDKIVGSVGRARDLDSRFRWKGDAGNEDRIRSIERAMERGDVLPPIEVYELGGKYFIIDGHHRVCAAKKLGQAFLDADVTSFIPRNRAGQAQSY